MSPARGLRGVPVRHTGTGLRSERDPGCFAGVGGEIPIASPRDRPRSEGESRFHHLRTGPDSQGISVPSPGSERVLVPSPRSEGSPAPHPGTVPGLR